MGLTLPGFVERSKVIASLPSLGLLTLAGMTPSRHHVAYIEVDRLTAEDGIRQQLDLGAHPDGAPDRAVPRPQVVGDAPSLDGVDAVVVGVHLAVGGVLADAERGRASEEVAHHLAHAGEPGHLA